MKRSVFILTLIAEAVVMGGLSLFTDLFPAWFTSAAAFPFEQIGLALGILSLSGSIGNGIAVALWVLISLSPVMVIFLSAKGKGKIWENLVLIVLSASLMICLYHMVNPNLVFPLLTGLGAEMIPAIKGVLGSAVWVIMIGYFVMRILRLFRGGSMRSLLNYTQVLLHLFCYLFIAEFFLFHPHELITNIGSSQGGSDVLQVILRFIVAVIPVIMSVWVCVRTLDLTGSFLTGDRERTTIFANRLSDLCVRALTLITFSSVVFNFILIMMIGRLSEAFVTIDIPIVSVAFVLAVLLLARLIEENRKLSEDNDLFI